MHIVELLSYLLSFHMFDCLMDLLICLLDRGWVTFIIKQEGGPTHIELIQRVGHLHLLYGVRPTDSATKV